MVLHPRSFVQLAALPAMPDAIALVHPWQRHF